jgi:putative addiction module component (TIGR02574 family)
MIYAILYTINLKGCMMSLNDIYNLPSSEKLHLIEQLWDRLDEKDISSPDWHKKILNDRKKRYENGELKLTSLEDFKKQR